MSAVLVKKKEVKRGSFQFSSNQNPTRLMTFPELLLKVFENLSYKH